MGGGALFGLVVSKGAAPSTSSTTRRTRSSSCASQEQPSTIKDPLGDAESWRGESNC
jgi:hypothetical protein